jgi:tetratricopeptide (TPR) repeat protein
MLLFPFILNAQNKKSDKYEKYQTSLDQKDYVSALKNINHIIEKDPNDEWAYLYRSEAYRLMGRIEDAFANVQTALNINSSNEACYNHAGILYETIGDYENAIKFYDEGKKIAPDSSKKIFVLNAASAKVRMKKYEEAYTDYMSIYQTDSNEIGLLNNLANILDDVGKPQEAIRLLKKVITLDSTFIGSYINLGFKYSQMGEYKKSIEYFDHALRLDPNEAVTYNNRGYTKYKMNDLDGALADVNRSIELYPGNSYAYRNRALIYIAKKRVNMACEDIEKSLIQGFTLSYGDEVEKLKAQYCK